jgi:hypothetical protein
MAQQLVQAVYGDVKDVFDTAKACAEYYGVERQRVLDSLRQETQLWVAAKEDVEFPQAGAYTITKVPRGNLGDLSRKWPWCSCLQYPT